MSQAQYRAVPPEDEPLLQDLMKYAFAPVEYAADDEEIPRMSIEEPRAVYVGDQLVAGCYLYSFSSRLRSKPTIVNGIGGVTAAPEHRRRGYTAVLLRGILDELRSRGIYLSTLYPFSFCFYAKYGWELAGEYRRCRLKPPALAEFNGDTHRYEFERAADCPGDDYLGELQQVYREWATRHDLTVERSKEWWLGRLLNQWGTRNLVCLCRRREDKQPVGYLIYRFQRNTSTRKRALRIEELGWTELGAYRALWGFIYQHDSQVQEIDCWLPADDPLPLIASDPEFEEHRVVPELMARVVDVKTAVEETPVKDTVAAELKHEPFCLELTDPVIEENCGSFRVSMVRSSQRLECTRTAGPGKLPTAKLSINALAQLISGFLSAQRLAALDKMELSTPELAPVLEALWPRANQYLSEPF